MWATQSSLLTRLWSHPELHNLYLLRLRVPCQLRKIPWIEQIGWFLQAPQYGGSIGIMGKGSWMKQFGVTAQCWGRGIGMTDPGTGMKRIINPQLPQNAVWLPGSKYALLAAMSPCPPMQSFSLNSPCICLFPPALLKCNWHIIWCKLKEYIVLIWYTYTTKWLPP